MRDSLFIKGQDKYCSMDTRAPSSTEARLEASVTAAHTTEVKREDRLYRPDGGVDVEGVEGDVDEEKKLRTEEEAVGGETVDEGRVEDQESSEGRHLKSCQSWPTGWLVRREAKPKTNIRARACNHIRLRRHNVIIRSLG